jgi:hypothetical protein
MKKLSLIRKIRRWSINQKELLVEVEALRKENERLRQKLASLQLAKDQAEKHAEDRRKEKEALRAKLGAQKKASDSQESIVEQLGAKITELRTEIDTLKRSRKKKN